MRVFVTGATGFLGSGNTPRRTKRDNLPRAGAEVQNIASLLKKKNASIDLRLGIDATKAELLDTDLSRFRFLHFATHGVLPVNGDIQEPSLILSFDGGAVEHMYLSMSEIFNLKLEAESVVLSALDSRPPRAQPLAEKGI